MRQTILSFLLFLVTTNFLYAEKSDLLTIAEKSDFKSTATFDDVIQFIDKLKTQSKHIKVETLAVSEMGKEIPLLMLANPMPESPKELKNDSRRVVYIQANIHAASNCCS